MEEVEIRSLHENNLQVYQRPKRETERKLPCSSADGNYVLCVSTAGRKGVKCFCHEEMIDD